MSSDATFPGNPFLASWLRVAQAAGAWPAEMARHQAAMMTAWNRQALALMAGGWSRPAEPAPLPAPAPAAEVAPMVAETVAIAAGPAVVEPTPEPAAVEAVAEPVAVPAPKPARKPKAVQLRAAPERRKAVEKAPAKKGPRPTRH